VTDLALGESAGKVDGRSFKNILTKKESWKDRTVFWNSYKARPTQTGDDKTSAIRSGDYKLLHFVETDKVELYNVKTDISEKTDLSKTMPEKTKALLDELNKWKSDRDIKMKENHRSGDDIEMSDKKLEKKAARKEERQKNKGN
jgi:arylsulfatase A-like enzyme